MWLVAIAWVYVVGLMAATQLTFIAGFFTFLFYCVVPLSILFYLTGGKQRRARRERKAAEAARTRNGDAEGGTHSSDGDGGD